MADEAAAAGTPTAAGGSPTSAAGQAPPDVVGPPADAATSAAADADAGASAAEGSLSFADHMWDRFDFLWQHRAEPSQHLMEQVTSVLRSRAQLERQYGNSLVTLPDEIEVDPSSSTVHEAVDSVMVNFRNRGQQCMDLAEQIENDVVLTFEEVLKQHKEASKKMFNDAQRLASYCRDTRQAHNKLARQYSTVCCEAETNGQECMHSLAMKSADRSKLGSRAVQLSKQAKMAQNDYLSSIEQANRAQALFEQHMPVVLAAMQEMEIKRAKCLRDCLMKLAVYETSWLRNLQYDIDATVKAIEVSDPEVDLQEFIKQHKAENAPAKGPQFTVKPFWDLGKSRSNQIPQQVQEARKQRAENDVVIKQHADGLYPMLSGFLAEDAPADFAQRWSPGVEQLKANLPDLRARAAFLQIFAKLIITRQPQEKQGVPLEDCLPVRITAACFEVVVALFLEACRVCEQENDAWSGKLLMVLVQLVHCEGEGGKKVPLLTRVYNHSVWNKVSFWEDVLLVGIFEAHSAEAIWRRQNPNNQAQASWAVSTPFGNKFVWFMGQFGIRGEQARTCIREGLRKHMQILGPAYDQYSRSLIAQVDAQEAAAAAQAAAAGPAAAPAAGFAPPPRQLEAAAHANAETASGAALEAGAQPEDASPTPSAGGTTLVAASGVDADDDFAAVALGVQGSFGEPSPAPEDSAVSGGSGVAAEAGATAAVAADDAGTTSPSTGSPGSKEPADTLRKLGVDQPSSSDVFG